MMVDFAIPAERDEHLSPEQSILKAALLRFRPIMMTTMAALFGGVPLMLGTGTGRKSATRSVTRWSAACSSARR